MNRFAVHIKCSAVVVLDAANEEEAQKIVKENIEAVTDPRMSHAHDMDLMHEEWEITSTSKQPE